MIPIKRFFNLGAPYHGLVVDGVLELPNTETVSVPFNVSTYTDILTNTAGAALAPELTVEQQAAHTAAGYQFFDYGIRNGNTFEAGLTVSGGTWALYSDPAGTPWILEWSRTLGGGGIALPYKLNLRGPWGRIRIGGTDSISGFEINRTLLDVSITPSNYPGGPEAGASQTDYIIQMRQNKQGNKLLLQVQRFWLEGFGDILAKKYLWGEGESAYLLTDVYEITLSGTGSLADATLGDGITASINQIDNFASLFTNNNTSFFSEDWESSFDLTTYCQWLDGPPDLTWANQLSGENTGKSSLNGNYSSGENWIAKLLAFYDASGTIQYLTKSYQAYGDGTVNVSINTTKTNLGVHSNEGQPDERTLWEITNEAAGTHVDTAYFGASITVSGFTQTGSYTSAQTQTWDTSYTYQIDRLTSAGEPPACSSTGEYNPGTWGPDPLATVETGDEKGYEVYASLLAANGLVLIARSYDDSGTKRYRRWIVAPDGGTLQIADVNTIDQAAMQPTGVAYNPVTGQIVYMPGQTVGFI